MNVPKYFEWESLDGNVLVELFFLKDVFDLIL